MNKNMGGHFKLTCLYDKWNLTFFQRTESNARSSKVDVTVHRVESTVYPVESMQ